MRQQHNPRQSLAQYIPYIGYISTRILSNNNVGSKMPPKINLHIYNAFIHRTGYYCTPVVQCASRCGAWIWFYHKRGEQNWHERESQADHAPLAGRPQRVRGPVRRYHCHRALRSSAPIPLAACRPQVGWARRRRAPAHMRAALPAPHPRVVPAPAACRRVFSATCLPPHRGRPPGPAGTSIARRRRRRPVAMPWRVLPWGRAPTELALVAECPRASAPGQKGTGPDRSRPTTPA
jgi:hypothetical protein